MDFTERRVNATWNRRTLLKSATAMSAAVGSIKSGIEASESRDGVPIHSASPIQKRAIDFLWPGSFASNAEGVMNICSEKYSCRTISNYL
jgi:hypothetical protein